MRVKLPEGMVEMNLEGVRHEADEDGVVDVPERYRDLVCRVHGGTPAPAKAEPEQPPAGGDKASDPATVTQIRAAGPKKK